MFLDLSKAFDTIDHQILLYKLELFGIRGTPLIWFKSYHGYLTNRQQYVNYQNSNSHLREMICGVPQGYVLGHLLFVIYVNDLLTSIKYTKCVQFADDTTVYLSRSNTSQISDQINTDLMMLTDNDWFYANKLSLNASQSNFMLCSNKLQTEATDIVISNESINRVDHFKFVGINLDENMTWKYHIDSCRAKLQSSLYAIANIKPFVTIYSLINLYYTSVYPHLTYGIILWGSTYATHVNRLFLSKQKVIRKMTNSSNFIPNLRTYFT